MTKRKNEPTVTVTITTGPAKPGQLEAWRKFYREMMTVNEKPGAVTPGKKG